MVLFHLHSKTDLSDYRKGAFRFLLIREQDRK